MVSKELRRKRGRATCTLATNRPMTSTVPGDSGISGARVHAAVAAARKPEIVQLRRPPEALVHFAQKERWPRSLNATRNLAKKTDVSMGAGAGGVTGARVLLLAVAVSSGRRGWSCKRRMSVAVSQSVRTRSSSLATLTAAAPTSIVNFQNGVTGVTALAVAEACSDAIGRSRVMALATESGARVR